MASLTLPLCTCKLVAGAEGSCIQRLPFVLLSKEAEGGSSRDLERGFALLAAPYGEQHSSQCSWLKGTGAEQLVAKKRRGEKPLILNQEFRGIFGCPCCWLWSVFKDSAHSLSATSAVEMTLPWAIAQSL